jgi:hypothetical protein
MKRTIRPDNVEEGDIVEFVMPDFAPKTNTPIPVGTKARFLEWVTEDGVDFSYASVIPIDVVPDTKGWIMTNPNILVVEEN